MRSYLVLCLLVVLCYDQHVVSYAFSSIRHHWHNKGSLTSSKQNCQHLSLSQETLSLADLSSEILSIVEKRNASDASKLTFRPGYTFGLGCSDWEASSYSGTIEGWSGEPFIQWISRSLLQELPFNIDSGSSDTDGKRAIVGEDIKKVEFKKKDHLETDVQSRVDMHFNVGTAVDVPHMRMTISETDHYYSIYLDYIPRVELLASMDYFDKYFENVEASYFAELENGIAEGIITIKGQPDSVLSKMLQSPFALSIDVDKKGGKFVKEICTNYISRWCDWIALATATYQEELAASQLIEQAASLDTDKSAHIDSKIVQDIAKVDKVVSMYERDQSIQKLLFESQKYELAKIMGVDFSPKAAELAAAIVGPSIGSASYSLF